MIDGHRKGSRLERLLPLGAVIVPIVFNLIELRSERIAVPYLNDSSVHVEMARFASNVIHQGSLPLESWYPYLGLGSAQFMHYQSLASMLIGLISGQGSVNTVFAWSIYLLVSLWPLCIYGAARVFGLSRWQSGAAAVLSSFVVSATGVGYEQVSYLYVGFGIWTQLWAMWTLPFAWAFSWQAVSRGRWYAPASISIALTMAFHFISGYLAVAGLVVWLLVERRAFARRLARVIGIGAAAFLLAAWVVVPLLQNSNWITINQALENSVDTDSYGARRVLSWLFSGQVFDAGHLPIISLLALVGFVCCLARSRDDARARAIVAVFVLSMILFFGRPTLGPLVDIIPASHDLFLRRFIMGVQLSGLLLAGIGAIYLATVLGRALDIAFPALRVAVRDRRWAGITAALLVGIVCVGLLAPAWRQAITKDFSDRSYFTYQVAQDASAGPALDSMIHLAESLGNGRIYAGTPNNWGLAFTIGSVPVFKYLANDDADEVGYTLRTESLMTEPENDFNDAFVDEYSLFGVRYLLFPAGRAVPPGSKLLAQSGPYALWSLEPDGLNNDSYVQVIDTSSSIKADRSDLETQMAPFIASSLPGRALYPTVAYAGRPAAAPTLAPGANPALSPGSVLSENADLVHGKLLTTIDARRAAVVLLKVSYDPGWTVTVDGKTAPTEMIAPAMIGVRVSSGTHTLVFRYTGYRHYRLLFLLMVLTIVGVTTVDVFNSRRSKRSLAGTDQA